MKIRPAHIILFGLVVLFIVIEVTGPKPLDWSPDFSMKKKTPFGGYALHQSLGDIFPEDRLETIEQPPMDFLDSFEGSGTNYIIITEKFESDEYEVDRMLDYAKKGNNLFIAASSFDKNLADELGFSVWPDIEGAIGNDVYLTLSYDIDPFSEFFALLRNIPYNSLSGLGKDGEILGENQANNTVFARFPVGKGWVYIHTVPLIFSNYYMVDEDNHRYVSKALSTLPAQITFWDEYYKPNRVKTRTPLVYILEKDALRYAWLLALVGLVIFMIFRAKRRQRVIPVIEPPQNTTLEFAETIGRLYLQHGDHKNMAKKKIKFFYDHVRTHLQVPTRRIDQEFIDRLAHKSGVDKSEVEALIHKIQRVEKAASLTDISLMDLSRSIDDFYQKSKK